MSAEASVWIKAPLIIVAEYFVGILTIIVLVVLGSVTAAWLWLIMEGVWALYGWTTGRG